MALAQALPPPSARRGAVAVNVCAESGRLWRRSRRRSAVHLGPPVVRDGIERGIRPGIAGGIQNPTCDPVPPAPPGWFDS
jgi:hypothetical protein